MDTAITPHTTCSSRMLLLLKGEGGFSSLEPEQSLDIPATTWVQRKYHPWVLNQISKVTEFLSYTLEASSAM